MANWAGGENAPCVLPGGQMSVYTTGMMPTTSPNPPFTGTSLSLAHCSHSLYVEGSVGITREYPPEGGESRVEFIDQSKNTEVKVGAPQMGV